MWGGAHYGLGESWSFISFQPCKRTVSSDAASESAQDVTVTDPSVGNASRRKAERISQAMRAYLERAKQFGKKQLVISLWYDRFFPQNTH